MAVSLDHEQPPIVVVEDLHVKYHVFSSGKSAGAEGVRGLLKRRARGLREVHALKGVSFVAHRNESIGVIGSNGSGKSTLLRAITGLTPPSSGAVYASSRPNLLGVGAALINDVSGDDNITLGCLALGYSRDEIEELRPKIIEFSELQDFIDLPMKTYSSGMSARLKFAIAACKQHDILIVDEALAVGDARFRKRSEARIREIRENAGTVFLVSHSMKSIRDTCNRTIWIEKGELILDGPTDEVVKAYEESRKTGVVKKPSPLAAAVPAPKPVPAVPAVQPAAVTPVPTPVPAVPAVPPAAVTPVPTPVPAVPAVPPAAVTPVPAVPVVPPAAVTPVPTPVPAPQKGADVTTSQGIAGASAAPTEPPALRSRARHRKE